MRYIQLGKQLASISDKLREADSNRSRLGKEKRDALSDLRAGRFCSKCGETSTEIERNTKTSFAVHLKEVGGVERRATQEELDAKEAHYDRLIAAADERFQELDQERTTLANEQWRIAPLGGLRELNDDSRAIGRDARWLLDDLARHAGELSARQQGEAGRLVDEHKSRPIERPTDFTVEANNLKQRHSVERSEFEQSAQQMAERLSAALRQAGPEAGLATPVNQVLRNLVPLRYEPTTANVVETSPPSVVTQKIAESNPHSTELSSAAEVPAVDVRAAQGNSEPEHSLAQKLRERLTVLREQSPEAAPRDLKFVEVSAADGAKAAARDLFGATLESLAAGEGLGESVRKGTDSAVVAGFRRSWSSLKSKLINGFIDSSEIVRRDAVTERLFPGRDYSALTQEEKAEVLSAVQDSDKRLILTDPNWGKRHFQHLIQPILDPEPKTTDGSD